MKLPEEEDYVEDEPAVELCRLTNTSSAANVDVYRSEYEAIEHQKSICKKQCLIVLILIIITLVVLFAEGIIP